MKQRFQRIGISIYLIQLLIHPLFSQQFANPSFEIVGPASQQPGPPWSFYLHSSTPDLQPGQWGVKRPAQHGSKFVSLIFRPDSSTEYLRQGLSEPLSPNTDYYFSVWLCYTEQFTPWGGTPAKLRFLARNQVFDSLEVLWTSPVIDHTGWKQYFVRFKTPNQPLSDVLFQAYYSGYASGGVMIDNIGLIQEGRVPEIDLGPDTSLCAGESLTLPVVYDGYSELRWQDGSSEREREISEAGTYILTASTDILTISDTLQVAYVEIPDVDLGADTSLCTGLELELHVNADDPDIQYLWENGSTEAHRTINEAGNYSIRLQKKHCSKSDQIHVQFRDCQLILEMPNVITPNEDGINDSFVPIVFQDVFKPQLKIFDRWGKLMYTSTSLDQGWHGEAPYGPAKEGIYFWILTYEDGFANQFVDKGSLTLLR
ncbi:MAG: gliding motility-associated C-terminal domain-containing protein [Bacteroidota bacterium]